MCGFDMGDDLMETLDLIDLGVVCISTFPLLKGTCEKVETTMATYYAMHREACLANQKKYDDSHKADRSVYNYNYYTDNVEKRKAYEATRKVERVAYMKAYRERKKAQAAK